MPKLTLTGQAELAGNSRQLLAERSFVGGRVWRGAWLPTDRHEKRPFEEGTKSLAFISMAASVGPTVLLSISRNPEF